MAVMNILKDVYETKDWPSTLDRYTVALEKVEKEFCSTATEAITQYNCTTGLCILSHLGKKCGLHKRQSDQRDSAHLKLPWLCLVETIRQQTDETILFQTEPLHERPTSF
ncbi:hypothetical protein L596_016344 [Steinernema carpocapsae]|uniref:Uncharacterized protein n=1 Tax=Steinernema carpocapsae TaxID=34508 RepID=A0A4U5NIB7_STECR|nr:hypothetical protein L596_016344 [Steinernema carpocapsae]